MIQGLTDLQKQLIGHEGIKLKLYNDSLGIGTLGVGRNVETRGISEDEALYLLNNDIQNCTNSLEKFDWYTQLTTNRKYVLIDMCFNMGIMRLLGFKDMIQALIDRKWICAADAMLNSKWADQVKSRAIDLHKMMVQG